MKPEATPVPTHMRRAHCTLCNHRFDVCPMPCRLRLYGAALSAIEARGCPQCGGSVRWLQVLGSQHDRPLSSEEISKLVVVSL